LIKQLITETNLSCLDISHILLGSNPDKKGRKQENGDYINFIYDNIKNPLEENLKEYKANINNKISLEYDIKIRKDKNYEIINDFDQDSVIKLCKQAGI
jgi:hypothetical protein